MSIMNNVSKVRLIHAEKKVNSSIHAIIDGVESELPLVEQVAYKRRFSERDDVAREIVEEMKKLNRDDIQSKAIIILSRQLCEVMKNNKEMADTFQDLILNDQRQGEHRLIALLWDKDLTWSDSVFVEAFAKRFVDHFKLHNFGVKCRVDPGDMKLPSFAKAILKQWTGPGDTDTSSDTGSSGIPMNEETTLDIDTIHIVHGGDKAAKQTVREISRELEDGFQLMDPTKYKLYNRIQEHQIPEIIMSEVQCIITNDGPNTLGVVIWCQRLLEIMIQSPPKDQFEDLILSASKLRVVHMCIGMSCYEIGRHFPKLAGLMIISLDNQDGTIETTDLISRVKLALDQRRGNLSGGTPAFGSTEANPPSGAQNVSSSDQLQMDDRKMSEPSFLSSHDGKAPTQMRNNPLLDLRPSIGLVGNPSNQNQQGGRVVIGTYPSHSMKSAAYTSDGNPGNHQPVHAQPSSGGSSQNKASKFVDVNGGSWDGGPPAIRSVDVISNGMMQIGNYPPQSNPPYIPSQSDSSQESHQALDQQPASKNNASRIYHQATPSESSSDTDRYLAKGDSMPVTSIHSLSFGSKEPVLPTSDATVECPSGVSSSNPNSNHNQHYPTTPNNFTNPSTNGKHFAGEIPPNIRPASHDDDMQRGSGNKIPRIDGRGSVSMTGATAPMASLHQDYPSGITPSIYSSAQSGGSGGGASFQSIPNRSNMSEGPASLPCTTSLNISAPISRQHNRSFGSGDKLFVQCAEDNPSVNGIHYATNMNSKDAFEQEDFREGSAQKLPVHAVAEPFRSLPSVPAGRRLREGIQNDEDRVHTTPPRINNTTGNHPFFNTEFPPELTNPPDYPIKDMDYRCREMLKIMLDPETNTGSDWKVFAYYFKMKFEEVKYVDSLMKSSTLYLFNWLIEKRPEVTCGDFKKAAQIHQRLDVVRKMTKFKY